MALPPDSTSSQQQSIADAADSTAVPLRLFIPAGEKHPAQGRQVNLTLDNVTRINKYIPAKDLANGIDIFIGHASPGSFSTLALVELQIPGATGPIPSGEWGINIAAARDNFPDNGLQLYVDAWTPPMSQGDSLQILLGTQVVTTKIIDANEVGQRVTAFIATRHLSDGTHVLSYKVTRIGQAPETSAETPIFVKLDRPGGKDENGSIPGHSELHLSLPQDVIENGVDADTAKAGVPVTIEPYPNMAAGDDIELSWGGQFIHHEVQAGEVQKPIVMTVDEATILAAGDSNELAVVFLVDDIVQNRSEDWSAPVPVLVDTGNSRLMAPIAAEAVNNVLDLDKLGANPLTLQIWVTDTDFSIGDRIFSTLSGTTVEGDPVLYEAPELLVDNLPHIYSQPIANATIRQLAKAQAVLSYRVVHSGSSESVSKRRFLTVIGEATRMAVPQALDAVQGAINPDLPSTRIEIPWDDTMAAGDQITLKWIGTYPNTTIYDPQLTPHNITNGEANEKLPIQMVVAGNHLKVIEGGTLMLYYLLAKEVDGTIMERESARAPALIVGEPRAELKAPEVGGVVDGVMDPVLLQTTLTVPVYPGGEIGDEVHILRKGSVTGEFTDFLVINSFTLNNPVVFDITAPKVAGNQGGTVEASYWVIRAIINRRSDSEILIFQVGAQQPSLPLPAPVIEEADGELLDSNKVLDGAHVLIGADAQLKVGDSVDFTWRGQAGLGSVISTYPVLVAGALRIDVAYATIKANDGHKVELSYQVKRNDGSTHGPSPLAAYEIKTAVGPGLLKVMGARFNRGSYPASATPRRISAFNATTNAPLNAEWQYEGDTAWTPATSWQDTRPDLVLRVRAGDDLVMLNPQNIVGSGGRLLVSKNPDFQPDPSPPPIDLDFGPPYVGDAALVARKDAGGTIGWGSIDHGARVPGDVITMSDIAEISCTASAYAARSKSGLVKVWGNPAEGGFMSGLSPDDFLAVSGNRVAFAGLKPPGRLVAWGRAEWGGSLPPDMVRLTDIIRVTGADHAFAALRSNGQVVAWGNAEQGGSVPQAIAALTDIVELRGNLTAFAALRANGRVVAWGQSGDGATVPEDIAALSDVRELAGSSARAFSLIRSTGQVMAWGADTHGGQVPSAIAALTDIREVCATARAFAARRDNGQVVAWGEESYGGSVPDAIAELDDIVQVVGNAKAFAALRRDGSVVAWGATELGAVVPDDAIGVQTIYANSQSFVALTSDGRVVTWGNPEGGGDSSAVQDQLRGQVSYLPLPPSRRSALPARRAAAQGR